MMPRNGERRGRVQLSPSRYDGVVLDLDGVITDTAGTHAAAWKSTFDEFLARHGQVEPFDIAKDYRRYVDGKPRYDGVQSFLESRGIDLPYGNASDPADRESVCGLGNRKNQLFLETLQQRGVRVYPESTRFIQALRRAGIGVAVASSSRNSRAVLAAAGIQGLFDACVDGTDLARLGLLGKPAPDMFLEASRLLQSPPERTAGIEDSIAGIQALKSAGFGCVIGVGEGDRKQLLDNQGADIVVGNLGEIAVVDAPAPEGQAATLSSPMECLDDLLAGREPAVFVDYDGTLTDIVDDPDAAVLSESMRTTLERLSTRCQVAVISGRDLKDVQAKVALPNLWYAGSHGFDIAGPQGEHKEHDQAEYFLPLLDRAEQALKAGLAAVSGCRVERKRFSVAVHYRRVVDADLPQVEAVVQKVQGEQGELRLAQGKKIFELQPDIAWDKGRALAWLTGVLQLNRTRFCVIYIGDDVTDEDGFREVAGSGIGIYVGRDDHLTLATYRLADPGAVESFLQALYERLEPQQSGEPSP